MKGYDISSEDYIGITVTENYMVEEQDSRGKTVYKQTSRTYEYCTEVVEDVRKLKEYLEVVLKPRSGVKIGKTKKPQDVQLQLEPVEDNHNSEVNSEVVLEAIGDWVQAVEDKTKKRNRAPFSSMS